MDGVILAGGKSLRMGAAKALLPIAERTLLEHQAALMQPCVEQLFIATHLLMNIKGTVVVNDFLEDQQGPLSGILAALKRSPQQALWIMPCDSFGFTSSLQTNLWQLLQKTGMDIAYLVCEGRDHPLMAIWRTHLVLELEAFLNSGGRSVLKWYSTQQVCQLQWLKSEQEFFNINTPEDYQDVLNTIC